MKKLKKILPLLLITVMTLMILTSCGKPKTTPEESAKIFLNVLLKGDKTNMDKIGMKEEDYTKFRTTVENELMKGFSSVGVDSSILTDKVKTDLKNDILKGLSKLEYEVVPVSTDKDTAKVQVKIKGFDMKKITETSQEKLKAEYAANPSMTQKEIYQSSFKLVGEGIANGIVVKEPKSVTLTLTKKDNIWLPGENDVTALMNVLIGLI